MHSARSTWRSSNRCSRPRACAGSPSRWANAPLIWRGFPEVSSLTSRRSYPISPTTAAIANLDLVITVDTALAHLAGATARPAWLMLRKVPDWRWLTDREDSPWYPTLRLFRQRVHGDWDEVVQRLHAALVRRLKEPNTNPHNE
jgi:hypothetical protein